MVHLRVHACPREGAQPIRDIHLQCRFHRRNRPLRRRLPVPCRSQAGFVLPKNWCCWRDDESLIEALASVVPAESLTVVADEAALAESTVERPRRRRVHRCGCGGPLPSRGNRAAGPATSHGTARCRAGRRRRRRGAERTGRPGWRWHDLPFRAQARLRTARKAVRGRRLAQTRGQRRASGIFPALSVPHPELLTPMPRESPWLPIAVGVAVVAVGGGLVRMARTCAAGRSTGGGAPAAASDRAYRRAPASTPDRAGPHRPLPPKRVRTDRAATVPAVVPAVVPAARAGSGARCGAACGACAHRGRQSSDRIGRDRRRAPPTMFGPSSTPPVSEARDPTLGGRRHPAPGVCRRSGVS